jgi:hypothetical protein
MPEPNQNDQNAGATGTGTTTSTGGQTTAGTSPHQATGTGAPNASATATPPGGGSTTGTGAPGATGSAADGTAAAATRSTAQQNPPQDSGVARRLARDLGNAKRELEQARQQIAAITGLTPPRPQAPARRLPQGVTDEMIQQAQAEFEIIHPRLAKLAALPDEVLEEFLGFVEKRGWSSIEEVTNRDWNRSAAATTRALNSEIKEQLGAVSEKTNARIFGAFRAELQSNDEFFQRYEAGDPDLVREFIADYKADFEGFSTRQAASTTTAASGTVARARTLPRGGTTSTVVPGQTETKPKTEDELHSRAWKRVQDARRASGAAA